MDVASNPFVHRLVDCISLQSDTYWYCFLQAFFVLAEKDKAYAWYSKEDILPMLDLKTGHKIRQDEDGQIYSLVMNNVLEETDWIFRIHHTHHKNWYTYV